MIKSLQPLCPSWRTRSEAECSKLLINTWSFWPPSPIPKLPRACWESPYGNKRHLPSRFSLRKFQGLGISVPGTGTNIKCLSYYTTNSFLHLPLHTCTLLQKPGSNQITRKTLCLEIFSVKCSSSMITNSASHRILEYTLVKFPATT